MGEARATHHRDVRRVVLLTLTLNVVVAVTKAIWGLATGSLAITSDAAHSALDATSNLFGLIALRMAAQRPDAEHPYGHGKIEIVTSAVVGLAIGATAVRFGWSAVDALIHGAPAPRTPDVGFAIVGGTLVLNVIVAWWEHRRGRALGSHFLQADAMHTASDVLVTVAVLGSMAAARAGVAWADPVAALAVVAIILRVAWRILADNLGILIDRAGVPAQEVVAVASAVPGVRGCHRVRSRGHAGAVLLDLHLEVDGALTVAAAHALSHEVEDRLLARFPDLADVTIHVEPDGDAPEPL